MSLSVVHQLEVRHFLFYLSWRLQINLNFVEVSLISQKRFIWNFGQIHYPRKQQIHFNLFLSSLLKSFFTALQTLISESISVHQSTRQKAPNWAAKTCIRILQGTYLTSMSSHEFTNSKNTNGHEKIQKIIRTLLIVPHCCFQFPDIWLSHFPVKYCGNWWHLNF